MKLSIKMPILGKDYGNQPRTLDLEITSDPKGFGLELSPAQARVLSAALLRAADAVESCQAAELEIAQITTIPEVDPGPMDDPRR